MNTNDKKENIIPIIHPEGYAYCPICEYFDLLPEHKYCPKCNQKLNWDWYERLKIRN